MSRQAKAARGWKPIFKPPYQGRPISAVARSLAFMAALFLLPACSGTTGAMLSGLLGAGGMFMGQDYLANNAQVQRDTMKWEITKEIHVAELANGMLAEARSEKAAGNFARWREIMGNLITFWDTRRPETLLAEVRRRVTD